jgi:tetratricopeptide (TPR) repeat protein
LLQLARARHLSDDDRREASLEEARAALLAAGRPELAAEADSLLAESAWYRRDREQCDRHVARAAALVVDLPDSPAKALVVSQVARYHMLADEYEEAIRIGEEALAMAERLGLDELRAHALDNIGTSRTSLGDGRGFAQLEQAAEIALAVRSPEASRALNNLSSAQAQLGDFRRRGELLVEAIRIAEELGGLALARFERAALVANLMWTGDWDDALRLAEEWQAEAGGAASSGELMILRNRAEVRLARDDVNGALDDLDRALAGSRQMGEPQVLLPALGVAAHVYVELERDDDARAAASEFMEHITGAADWRILEFSFVAARLGHADGLRRLIEKLPPTRMNDADLALVSNEFGRAAELLEEGGMAFAAACARLLEGQRLSGDGRQREAAEQLEKALAFYRSVGATRYVRQAEALGAISEVSA